VEANDPEGIEVLRTVRAATADSALRGEIGNELASSPGVRNGNDEAARLIEAQARPRVAVRPRKAVFTGVESLTPSELRVARLAAEGMTNREIAQSLTVTAKTVETHLCHVHQKLNIAKRTELGGALG
jgi:DNA-binding NarL/FixJ family response regulator